MSQIYVQFSSSDESKVISILWSEQDVTYYPYQGFVDLSDQRYVDFYNSMPTEIQNQLPTPE